MLVLTSQYCQIQQLFLTFISLMTTVTTRKHFKEMKNTKHIFINNCSRIKVPTREHRMQITGLCNILPEKCSHCITAFYFLHRGTLHPIQFRNSLFCERYELCEELSEHCYKLSADILYSCKHSL